MSPHIEFLIEEKKIVRILQPQLCLLIQQNIQNHPEALPYLLHYEDQMYLSLQTITDRRRREKIFNLLQKHQLGQRVDLTLLPNPLRSLIQPPPPSLNIVHASLLGAGMGLIFGILGMALGALVMTIAGLSNSTVFGVGFTAASFIIFAALGWIGTTIFLWPKVQANPLARRPAR